MATIHATPIKSFKTGLQVCQDGMTLPGLFYVYPSMLFHRYVGIPYIQPECSI